MSSNGSEHAVLCCWTVWLHLQLQLQYSDVHDADLRFPFKSPCWHTLFATLFLVCTAMPLAFVSLSWVGDWGRLTTCSQWVLSYWAELWPSEHQGLHCIAQCCVMAVLCLTAMPDCDVRPCCRAVLAATEIPFPKLAATEAPCPKLAATERPREKTCSYGNTFPPKLKRGPSSSLLIAGLFFPGDGPQGPCYGSCGCSVHIPQKR
jgi:hypothetical protein